MIPKINPAQDREYDCDVVPSKEEWVKRVLAVLISLCLFQSGLGDLTISDKTKKIMLERYGFSAKQRLDKYEKMLSKAETKSDLDKLKTVNDFFNRVKYSPDKKNWGEEDYWATPMEFLGLYKGDCEDYAIAKFFALKRLGIPPKKLFFSYVIQVHLNQAHMVLAYYETTNTVPLIMDNFNRRILPADKRSDLAHVYSFNAEELYLDKQKSLGKVVPSILKQNEKWAQFLRKTERELL